MQKKEHSVQSEWRLKNKKYSGEKLSDTFSEKTFSTAKYISRAGLYAATSCVKPSPRL